MDIHFKTKTGLNKEFQISLSKRKWFYLIYTILFSILFLFCFSLFWLYGKAPVWSADGISQHFPGVIYMRNWLAEGWNNLCSGNGLKLRQWDSKIGFGDDVLNVISFRPIAWIAILFDERHIIDYLWFTIALRMYLTGITFCEYGLYRGFDRYATLIAGLLYTFSSYTMYYAPKHYMFTNMMFLLPLLCLGIEKIFKEKKKFVFAIGVTAAAWSYIYMLYILMVFAVFYYFIGFFFHEKKHNYKLFLSSALKCCFGGIIGLSVAMLSVLPAVIQAFQSDRVGENHVKTYTCSWHYIKTFYIDYILHLFDSKELYSGLILGISGLGGIAILFMLFSTKLKKYFEYKVAYAFITLLLLIPAGAVLFNAFSGSGFRWCFGYHFLISVILAAALPDIIRISKQTLFKIAFAEMMYLLILLCLFLIGKEINVLGFFSIFIFTLWLFFTVVWDKRGMGITSKILLFTLVALEIVLKSVNLYSPYGENYLSEFHDDRTINYEVDSLAAAAVKQLSDTSVYRVDEIDNDFYESVYNRNYGLRAGVNGVSSFYSYSDGGIRAYADAVGLAQQPAPFCILNLAHRTGLNTLNAVKYITVPEQINAGLPYGYKFLKTVKLLDAYGDMQDVRIYENQYSLPYMYCYDSYIAEKDYMQLSATQREQAMLQGIVLEDEIDYPKTKLQFDEKVILTSDEILAQLKEKNRDSTSIIIGDNWIKTLRNNVSITLDFEGIERAESYIKWSDLEFVPLSKKNDSNIVLGKNASRMEKLNYELQDMFGDTVSVSRIILDSTQSIYLLDEYEKYYKGAVDAVGNLGYMEEPENKVKLTFTNSGLYKFSDMQISAQPMDHYAEKVNQLKKNPVEDIRLIQDGIRGNVRLEKEQLVYINIPYKAGWTAYVNDKRVKIYRANQMGMAIIAERGNNEIELRYEIPGLKWGGYITLLSIGICVLFHLLRYFIKNKRRKGNVL